MKQTLSTLSVVLAATILISCGAASMTTANAQHGEAASDLPTFTNVKEAVAVIHPTSEGDARGLVHFRQLDAGQVLITARVEGLAPNAKHGFHVHQYGDCSADDGTSAGGHYNPEGHPHSLPNGDQLHAGDMGNLQADENGVAELELTVDNISVAGTHNPVIARAVIVHQDEDDGSQPTGNAGARIGCGVIGVAQAGE